jgi:hypothetical protein
LLSSRRAGRPPGGAGRQGTIRIKKDDPEAHNNLGIALYAKGPL